MRSTCFPLLEVRLQNSNEKYRYERRHAPHEELPSRIRIPRRERNIADSWLLLRWIYFSSQIGEHFEYHLNCARFWVSLQVLRGITSWRFRFREVIRSDRERRITTLIWLSQSDTGNTRYGHTCYWHIHAIGTKIACTNFPPPKRLRYRH